MEITSLPLRSSVRAADHLDGGNIKCVLPQNYNLDVSLF